VTGQGWRELKISGIKVMLRAVPRSNHEIVFEGVDAVLRTRDGRGGGLDWHDRDAEVDSPRPRMNEKGQGVPGPRDSAISDRKNPLQTGGAARSWDGEPNPCPERPTTPTSQRGGLPGAPGLGGGPPLL